MAVINTVEKGHSQGHNVTFVERGLKLESKKEQVLIQETKRCGLSISDCTINSPRVFAMTCLLV
jgi:hypothetical protein